MVGMMIDSMKATLKIIAIAPFKDVSFDFISFSNSLSFFGLKKVLG